ncbi:MAG: type VI secretion system secreted protein VgrG [Halocynthiibacter sp.]|jgi:type VI secretion system secreted protein VgrG
MSSLFSQSTREGKLNTALGEDALVLLRFEVREYVDQLFEYTVEALSVEDHINFDNLLGTQAEISVLCEGDTRYFTGYVSEAVWTGSGENGYTYRLTMRPWFWLLSQRRTQRIFHEMSVNNILSAVFAPYSSLGSPAFKDETQNDAGTLEYTVQYGESDLDFAQRLMERFGISYYFRHTETGHTLVLVDQILKFDHIPANKRPFVGVSGQHHAEGEHFSEWGPGRHLTTGAVRLTDYNFKSPTKKMEAEQIGTANYQQGKLESYEYPGDYDLPEQGKGVAKRRLDQSRARDHWHFARGDVISLNAGMIVELTGFQVPGVKGAEYLCLEAHHTFISDSYGSGDGPKEGYTYAGDYVLTATTEPYGPARTTPSPKMSGVQTAVVVGDGEIDCDEFGRILVKFHWDLESAHSMRCRVSQNWAGNGWGGMVIPRIGMEVVVDFINGDPDKPIVTGCVYNGRNDPPYALPEHKTRSTFRTDSHEAEGYNELRFEDKAGKEEIYLHAQFDLNQKVNNHATTRIDQTYVRSIGKNKVSETAKFDHHTVGGSMTLKITGEGENVHAVGGAESDDQGILDLAKSTESEAENGGEMGNYTITVSQDTFNTTGRDVEESSGRDTTQTIGRDFTREVVGEMVTDVTLSQEDKIGKKLKIDVGDQISLICGNSSIVMKKNGAIEIKGSTIKLKGSKIDMN